MPFQRFIEIDRIAVLHDGPRADKIVAIVDVINQNKVLIDEPQASVELQEYKIKSLQLMPLKDTFASLPEAMHGDNVGAAQNFTGQIIDLKAARPYGVGAQSFYKNVQVGQDAKGKVVPAEAGQKELYVALTSDRGLCGAIHSSICKAIRNELLEKPNLDNVAIICVGDKSRAQLAR